MDALPLPALVALIGVALVFDLLNGLHDAANSIATVVATRVLRPQIAIVWAAFFNFIAFAVFGLHVAQTIGTGIVSAGVIDASVVFGALFGAIVWNLVTWTFGIPSSSSHALIGGLTGAAIAKAGFGSVVFGGLALTALGIVLSPLLGFVLAQLLVVIVYWINRRAAPFAVDRRFRVLQLLSAAMYSLGHGGNDAQKTMGIIVAALVATGNLVVAKGQRPEVPFWVVIICHAAMGLGTLSGGWRIVKTMGMNITKLRPVGGFCAETAGAITLFGATAAGIPVSTTHTITGAIVGVGVTATRRLSAVKWGVAGRIVWAWILTMPLAAILAALCALALRATGWPR
jgi:inorganic phosphate transporter, PiT family